MDDLAVLRLTSSRPVYRRGGVALSNVPVDIQRGQDGGILTPEAMLALARDPVVKMHGSTDGETFTAITDAEREELAVALKAMIEAKAAEANPETAAIVEKVTETANADADAKEAAAAAEAQTVKTEAIKAEPAKAAPAKADKKK